MMSDETYLVTTTVNDRSWKTFWDASAPLKLDHPVYWQLVYVNDEIQIQTLNGQPLAVDSRYLLAGRKILLPSAEGLSRQIKVQIKKIKKIPPPYMAVIDPRIKLAKTDTFISFGIRESLIRFQPLKKRYQGNIEGLPIFILERIQGGVVISARQKQVRFKIAGKEWIPILPGVGKKLTFEELIGGAIFWRSYWWRMNSIPVPQMPTADELEEDAEEQASLPLKTIGRSIATAFVLVMVISRLLHYIEKSKEPPPPVKVRVEIKKPKIIPQAFQTPKPPLPPPPKPPEPKPEPPKPKPPAPKPPPKPKPEPPKPKALPPRPVKHLPPPPKHLPPPPKPVAPHPVAAQHPAKIQPKPALPPPKVVPQGPPPEVVKQQNDKATVTKALGFLSTLSKKSAAVPSVVSNEKADQHFQDRGAVALSQKTSALSKYDTDTTSGEISTKSARNMSSGLTLKGSKALNDVQGRVSLSSKYGKGSGEALQGVITDEGVTVSGPGQLSDALIEKTLAKYLTRFQYCYEKALLSNPSLSGTVQMQWTIQVGGGVSGISIARSDMNSAALNKCLSGELSKIVFPSPKGGAVIIKKPFAFTSRAL